MGANLKVDYYTLADSARTLSDLKSEFDGIKDRTGDTSRIWGHDSVADAMAEFSGNMDYNRGKLSEEIDVTGQKMADTLETFRELDAELAASFDEERGQ